MAINGIFTSVSLIAVSLFKILEDYIKHFQAINGIFTSTKEQSLKQKRQIIDKNNKTSIS